LLGGRSPAAGWLHGVGTIAAASGCRTRPPGRWPNRRYRTQPLTRRWRGTLEGQRERYRTGVTASLLGALAGERPGHRAAPDTPAGIAHPVAEAAVGRLRVERDAIADIFRGVRLGVRQTQVQPGCHSGRTDTHVSTRAAEPRAVASIQAEGRTRTSFRQPLTARGLMIGQANHAPRGAGRLQWTPNSD